MGKEMPDKKKYEEFDSEVIPHIQTLKSFALKMTRNLDDSEDLLQDTLLNAFRFFHNYEKGSNVKAWLFKIMKNTFINYYRKNQKEPIMVDYEDVQYFYESVKSEDVLTSHYQHDAFANALGDEIVKTLSLLPDDFRTIAILSDIEGYSYKEISDFVDCPIGTVRSRLHRTRKILYSLLYNYAQKNSYVRSNAS